MRILFSAVQNTNSSQVLEGSDLLIFSVLLSDKKTLAGTVQKAKSVLEGSDLLVS
jgi:hypothetical protein